MKKNILLISILFCVYSSKAQLTVTPNLDSTQITNLLQGLGVTISNLSVNCPGSAFGEFSGTSEMSITHGLVMTTGSAMTVIGPNNIGSAGSDNGIPGDHDLDSLAVNTTYDACILEFDALPNDDTLYFNFSFASEEYLEFCFAGVNDAFAVFLNGPGISGRINAATIPGGTPVTIDSVNSTLNAAYYYDNGDGFGSGTAPDGLYVQYDGFTSNLMGFAVVIPDSSYHFKIAIADAGDGVWDSGVFLEAFSFRCVEAEPIDLTGIHETSFSELSVYPNPSSGSYFINDKENRLQGSELVVMNVLGKEIFSQKIANTISKIDISNQPAGIYFVGVNTSEGVFNAKLIKK